MFRYILLLLIIISPNFLLAEDSTIDPIEELVVQDTPTPEVQVTPTPTREEEPLIWERDLAENSFSINKNQANFARLVFAFEKLTGFHCFSDLFKSLIHDPKNNTQSCNQYIEKLLILYPKDVVAICARDGIDSESCINQEKETLVTERSEDNSQVAQQLNDKLAEQRTADQIKKLQEELYQIDYAPANDAPALAERVKKILAIHHSLISITCKDDSIIMQSDQYGYNTTELAPAESFKRMRAIRRDCKNYASRALTYDKMFPSAICAQYGKYSPYCIQALREKRKLPASQQQRRSPQTSMQNRKAPPVKQELQEF